MMASGALGNCRSLSYIYVVSWNLNVDEDWDEPVLNNRVDGGGNQQLRCDDLVSGRRVCDRREREKLDTTEPREVMEDPS
jgi:hypothetical protein